MLEVDPLASVDETPGFRRMFRAGRLTLGVFFPIEAFTGDEPLMRDQERLAQRPSASGDPRLSCVKHEAVRPSCCG